jgi:hypothetical protein
MMNTRAQRRLLHTWIISDIVKQHLVPTGQTDGPAEYLSHVLDAIRSDGLHPLQFTDSRRTPVQIAGYEKERMFIEIMTSDRELKPPRKYSK